MSLGHTEKTAYLTFSATAKRSASGSLAKTRLILFCSAVAYAKSRAPASSGFGYLTVEKRGSGVACKVSTSTSYSPSKANRSSHLCLDHHHILSEPKLSAKLFDVYPAGPVYWRVDEGRRALDPLRSISKPAQSFIILHKDLSRNEMEVWLLV